MNAERLSPTEASSLLGIPYEVVLRYTRELEKQGLIEVHREHSGRLFLSPADLDLLRKHHENRPIASRFMLEGDIEPHKHAVRDLNTLASTLEAMAKLARRRIKQMVQGPFSSTTWITTLPVVGLTLRKPIAVTVVSDGKAFSAFSADTGSTAYGQNRVQAVRALRKQLAAEYQYLGQLASLSQDEAERLSDLKGFISDSLREEVP
jgi:DNA-binding MarR family transcriptional regulator